MDFDEASVRSRTGQMFTETIVEVSTEPRVELFVARSGGPADRALLVIHGGPDWDHTYLRDPLAEMAGRIQLIMPDIRGCGRSTCGLASDYYTPEAVVSDLAVLLGQLGLTCADVLGFSYGGLLAQRLAISHPSLVRRLIIASSSICPVPPDAYDAWPEREAHRAAEAAVWASPGQPTAALVRAAAVGARHDLPRQPGGQGRFSDTRG
jgi:pimeloyl-ACP methyl ester carboxylesterase